MSGPSDTHIGDRDSNPADLNMPISQIKTISTVPFGDQRPGTSGLRKKTREFMQPNYLENFVQCVFDAIRDESGVDFSDSTLVVGGDGRYYNRPAIQTIIRIAAGNGFGRLLIARGGILSTPAMSAVIRRRNALGGLVLSASHNPGGLDEDFGIKYNVQNGGPAPEEVTERIFRETLKIERYITVESADVDIDREGCLKLADTEVAVFDPLADYTALMEELFDFEVLRAHFRSGFRMLFDAMHGATGPYARHIFEERLGAPPGTVVHGIPLEDFGGHHPDPNLVYAADLVHKLADADAPDFGAACDADGDRNMILGRNIFVSPGDSLAVIAEHAARSIPGYGIGLSGVARSLPTSTAVDRVAQAAGIKSFETPTGWKYFANLLDAGLCTLCGEESFGTGSNHMREKDGIWAVLCWLSLLAVAKKSVAEVLQDHWRKFGRSYFRRHDYEKLESRSAAATMQDFGSQIPALAGRTFGNFVVSSAEDVTYRDPVTGAETEHAGIRIRFSNESRIVVRLSGTGTDGATLRLYLERYDREDTDGDVEAVLEPLAKIARELLGLQQRFGRERPTLIT
jgi:phosphoglucomutase